MKFKFRWSPVFAIVFALSQFRQSVCSCEECPESPPTDATNPEISLTWSRKFSTEGADVINPECHVKIGASRPALVRFGRRKNEKFTEWIGSTQSFVYAYYCGSGIVDFRLYARNEDIIYIGSIVGSKVTLDKMVSPSATNSNADLGEFLTFASLLADIVTDPALPARLKEKSCHARLKLLDEQVWPQLKELSRMVDAPTDITIEVSDKVEILDVKKVKLRPEALYETVREMKPLPPPDQIPNKIKMPRWLSWIGEL